MSALHYEPAAIFEDADADPIIPSEIYTAEELEQIEKLQRQWETEARSTVAQSARDLKAQLAATGTDLVDHLHAQDIPLHSAQADQMAASLGYRSIAWSDQRNVTRRAVAATRAVNAGASAVRAAALLAAQQNEQRQEPAQRQDAPQDSYRDSYTEPEGTFPAGLAEIIRHALATHDLNAKAKTEARAAAKRARLAQEALRAELARLRVEQNVEEQPEPFYPEDADFLPWLERGQAYFTDLAAQYPQHTDALLSAWRYSLKSFRSYVELRLTIANRGRSTATRADFDTAAASWLRGAIFTANVKAGIE